MLNYEGIEHGLINAHVKKDRVSFISFLELLQEFECEKFVTDFLLILGSLSMPR